MSTTQSLPYFREIMDLIKIIIVELAGKIVIVTGVHTKCIIVLIQKLRLKLAPGMLFKGLMHPSPEKLYTLYDNKTVYNSAVSTLTRRQSFKNMIHHLKDLILVR